MCPPKYNNGGHVNALSTQQKCSEGVLNIWAGVDCLGFAPRSNSLVYEPFGCILTVGLKRKNSEFDYCLAAINCPLTTR